MTFRTTTELNIFRKKIIVLCSISKCLILPKILTYRVKIKSRCSIHPRRYFFTSYRIEWTMIQIEQTHIGRSMTKCHDSSRLKISSGGTGMLLFYEIYVAICTSVPQKYGCLCCYILRLDCSIATNNFLFRFSGTSTCIYWTILIPYISKIAMF